MSEPTGAPIHDERGNVVKSSKGTAPIGYIYCPGTDELKVDVAEQSLQYFRSITKLIDTLQQKSRSIRSDSYGMDRYAKKTDCQSILYVDQVLQDYGQNCARKSRVTSTGRKSPTLWEVWQGQTSQRAAWVGAAATTFCLWQLLMGESPESTAEFYYGGETTCLCRCYESQNQGFQLTITPRQKFKEG